MGQSSSAENKRKSKGRRKSQTNNKSRNKGDKNEKTIPILASSATKRQMTASPAVQDTSKSTINAASKSTSKATTRTPLASVNPGTTVKTGVPGVPGSIGSSDRCANQVPRSQVPQKVATSPIVKGVHVAAALLLSGSWTYTNACSNKINTARIDSDGRLWTEYDTKSVGTFEIDINRIVLRYNDGSFVSAYLQGTTELIFPGYESKHHTLTDDKNKFKEDYVWKRSGL